jgi:predicted dehydrogenase
LGVTLRKRPERAGRNITPRIESRGRPFAATAFLRLFHIFAGKSHPGGYNYRRFFLENTLMGIHLGLVGLGSFGSAFAELFMAHPSVGRVALCDREEERIRAFADKKSWQRSGKFDPENCYATLDDICRTDVDALVVITQPWLHAPQCIQAMEAGKSVYSAVPVIMVPDGEEILGWCDKLVETARRTGKHYMLGETTYYRPEAMYCRRRAAEGAFGRFVYAEGEYFHDYVLPACSLKNVQRKREASASGQEWVKRKREYFDRGVVNGPMHYPTHSVSGPICVMQTRATKVACLGYEHVGGDAYFTETGQKLSNETALFRMSNDSVMRICEYREIGCPGSETFRVFGTDASFSDKQWMDKTDRTALTVDDMRDPLDAEFMQAYAELNPGKDIYGGHGGSHAYLVDEFCRAVAEDRTPAINVWEAVRYMAAGVMAHKSALRDGEWLEVPDWGDAPA